ncbi:hypothetical protein Ae201684P_012928 [Aphanomyces euteiches]|uniref:Uncharacterized protein n=1 Tax=Aphanomyces euteiches TaxID=100861 RepID=A0A6G0XG46_9STRA|nr:hypothetical protein Ae201684_005126 [Aphanomyces euteiches]KAH9080790.1 hypothetical protein Ae201684P_012928 [Aphanomyces euteiches]
MAPADIQTPPSECPEASPSTLDSTSRRHWNSCNFASFVQEYVDTWQNLPTTGFRVCNSHASRKGGTGSLMEG